MTDVKGFPPLGSKDSLTALGKYFSEAPNHLPTGVDFIDDITYGGLYGGLSILCGVPNVGKTTLLVQIAVALSRQGVPVVYISKDMQKEEVMVKAVSHIASEDCGCELGINDLTEMLSSGKALSEDLEKAVIDACGMLHIIDFNRGTLQGVDLSELTEGSDFGKLVEYFSKMYDLASVFIVDSLQSIALSYEKSSKEGVDIALAELKYYIQKYKTRMLVVSNLSRAFYNKELTINALKETGNAEYEASCVLAMEIAGSRMSMNDFRQNLVRKIKIRNLKDRAGGYKELVVEFDVVKSTFKLSEKAEPSAPAKKNRAVSKDRYDKDALFKGISDNPFEEFMKRGKTAD